MAKLTLAVPGSWWDIWRRAGMQWARENPRGNAMRAAEQYGAMGPGMRGRQSPRGRAYLEGIRYVEAVRSNPDERTTWGT